MKTLFCISLCLLFTVSIGCGRVERVRSEDLGRKIKVQTEELRWGDAIMDLPDEVTVFRVAPADDKSGLIQELASELGFKPSPSIPVQFGTAVQGGRSFRGDGDFEILSYNSPRGQFSLSLRDWISVNRDEAGHPTVSNVPTPEEAYDLALAMFPRFGLNVEDFWTDENGKLEHRAKSSRIRFNDRETGERRHVLTNLEIAFYRRVGPHRVLAFGAGGQASFTFVSEGDLAKVDWAMRGVEPLGDYPVLGKPELLNAVRSGKVFGSIPDFECGLLHVVDVWIACFENNPETPQQHFTPVYVLQCLVEGGERDGETINLRLPALRAHQ